MDLKINQSKDLLRQVSDILELRRMRPPAPGEKFNIFSVLNLEEAEVGTHSSLLYELLSPNGSHGMGDKFLQEFFMLVLGQPYQKGVQVCREYIIPGSDNYGRIDILIQGADCCYPIEVKIYAGDQYRQIKRYDEYAETWRNHQVYYLTLYGNEPSKESAGGVKPVCISFKAEIRQWLLRCGEIAWDVPNVAEIIRQYVKLLDKLTGNVESDIYMDQIKKLLRSSQIQFESALEIEKALPSVKSEMMKEVFRKIETHMAQMDSSLQRMDCTYIESHMTKMDPDRRKIDFIDVDSSADGYYKERGRYYPSINYLLKECGDSKVILRFEVEWNLFFGIVVMNEIDKCSASGSSLMEAYDNDAWRKCVKEHDSKDGWWLWWKYLPGDAEDDRLNFKELSGRYLELYDPEKHEKLMREIFEKIDSHIDSICTKGVYE